MNILFEYDISTKSSVMEESPCGKSCDDYASLASFGKDIIAEQEVKI